MPLSSPNPSTVAVGTELPRGSDSAGVDAVTHSAKSSQVGSVARIPSRAPAKGICRLTTALDLPLRDLEPDVTAKLLDRFRHVVHRVDVLEVDPEAQRVERVSELLHNTPS